MKCNCGHNSERDFPVAGNISVVGTRENRNLPVYACPKCGLLRKQSGDFIRSEPQTLAGGKAASDSELLRKLVACILRHDPDPKSSRFQTLNPDGPNHWVPEYDPISGLANIVRQLHTAKKAQGEYNRLLATLVDFMGQ